MKRHLQCAEQQESAANFSKYCACHEKWISWLILVTNETLFTMRRATCVIVQTHQILPLPRKMTPMTDPGHTWNVIYNAQSNMCHSPNSPNTAPATKNDRPKSQRNLLKTDETSFTMRGRSENDPSMIRPWSEHGTVSPQPASQPRLHFALATSMFYGKIQHFALGLSFQISPNTAPATKIDSATSPNTAPATKYDSHDQSSSHIKHYLQWAMTWLNWAMTWLSYYLTELWLDWAVTWLSYWLDWAITWLSYDLTELWLDWAMTWLSYDLTELWLDWAMTWLSCDLTELWLDRAMTWLSYDLTELWLDWAVTWLSLLCDLVRKSEVSQLNFLWSYPCPEPNQFLCFCFDRSSKTKVEEELPFGHGSWPGMFSARFDGGLMEERFRNVYRILKEHHYDVLMVQAEPADNFGLLTMDYLGRLKNKDGIMIAVATWHYGEWKEHPFGTFSEMSYAVNNNIRFLPLRVEDTYPPQPPGAHQNIVRACINTAFNNGLLYLDCRGNSDMEIAMKIAPVLLAKRRSKLPRSPPPTIPDWCLQFHLDPLNQRSCWDSTSGATKVWHHDAKKMMEGAPVSSHAGAAHGQFGAMWGMWSCLNRLAIVPALKIAALFSRPFLESRLPVTWPLTGGGPLGSTAPCDAGTDSHLRADGGRQGDDWVGGSTVRETKTT